MCVHTNDRYDLDIAVLTLKFLMGCFYVVLNKTFIIKMVGFKEGREIQWLSLRIKLMIVDHSFWIFWNRGLTLVQ